MFENFKLSDIKGAPLSILVYLSLSGKGSVSISELTALEATGYSEKPLRAGMQKLCELGIVTETRKRYQLTGKEYQLPLSWGEKILPAGDCAGNSGVSPVVSGVSPELEKRVRLLEKAVFGNEDQNPGDSPVVPGDFALWDSERDEDPEIVVEPREEWSGNTAGKMGVFPLFSGQKLPASSQRVEVIDYQKPETGDSAGISGVSPEISADNPEGLINNIILPENNIVSLLVDTDKQTNKESIESGDINREQADQAWNVMLGQMKSQMETGAYKTLLGGAVVTGYEDGHFTVAERNSFERSWAEQRLTATVEKILSAAMGIKVSVSFVVADADETGHAGTYPAVPADAAGQSRYVPDVPVLLPVPEDPVGAELAEICNDYLADPVGIDYSTEELRELVELRPDPRVLRFILPRASTFVKAKEKCRVSFQAAKDKMLAYKHIQNPARQKFVENDKVTLELIEDVCANCDPKDTGLMITKIKDLAV